MLLNKVRKDNEVNKEKFVFVVVVYKNMEDLLPMIKNVRKKIEHSDFVVVNNFYDKESKEVAEKITIENGCHFLNVENKGYGHGNNIGIEYTINKIDYDYIVVANSDIIINKFNIENLSKFSDGLIGPLIKTSSGKNQNPYWAIKNVVSEFHIYKGYKKGNKSILFLGIAVNKIIRELFLLKFLLSSKKYMKTFALHGSFVIFPKKVIAQLNLVYDNKMFLFAEEAYLAHLLRKKGINSYITKEIEIVHKEDGSMEGSNININGELSKSVIYYYEKMVKKKGG